MIRLNGLDDRVACLAGGCVSNDWFGIRLA